MIIAIDTETYKYDKEDGVYRPVLNAQEFTLGCAKTDTGKTRFFYDRKGMFNWLKDIIEQNKKYGKRTFIYAHNMEYDYYAIFKGNFLDPRMKYICYNPFISIYSEKGYFLDTMAFYKMSLDRVGKLLGFPKGKLPMEVKSMEEVKPYLERDTEIVLLAIKKLKERVNELGFNPRKLLTAGQLAITSFLTYCRREKLDWDFTEFDLDKKIRQIIKCKRPLLVREAFRGGMNQCYKLGKFEEVTLVDANALYGYIMTKMDFPDLHTETYIEKPEVRMLEQYIKNNIGVARITIKAPKIALPFLPIRFAKYTVFPTNTVMRGTWTFLEIEQAIKLGYEIVECEWCTKWKKAKVNPLKRFVEYLFEMEKKLKTKEEKMPLKLIRNNLYGKFAQYRTNKDYKVIPRYKIQEYLVDGYKPVAEVEEKYICVKELDDYDPSYTNPIISTIITAGARIYLYEHLKKVPLDDLIYCDTDSVAFKGNHITKFNIGAELGEWKIEAIGEAKFLGEKRYYIDDKPKISGLMRKEINVDIIENEKDVKTQRMVGLKTGIKEGNLGEVGKFRQHIQEMKPHNKLMLFLPEYIDEVKHYG